MPTCYIGAMIERITASFEQHWLGLLARLPFLLEAALVLILFVLLAYGVNSLVARRLQRRSKDRLRALFLARVVKWVVVLMGVTLAMRIAGYGDIAAGMLAGAGVSALVVGFALKDIGENFLAGFLLSFSRPFRIDDTIEVDGVKGVVRALNLRNTRVKTMDGRDVFIPNASLIKNNLQNYTLDGFMRYEFTMGVDDEADLALVRSTIHAVLKAHPRVASHHAPSAVNFNDLGSGVYNILVQYWVDMFDANTDPPTVRTELAEGILKAMNQAGVRMPPQVMEVRNAP